MNVSISEVAKAANVSVATVSRVFNKSGKVAEDTRIRIQEAAEKLNYHPTRGGQIQKKQKTHALLVLVSDIGNPFFSDILFGMDETAQIYGYNLLVVSTYFSASREKKMMKYLDTGIASGAILLASTMPKEIIDDYDARYPIVQCCDYNEESTSAHVSIDNYKAACQATEFFVNSGHRRIAMLGISNSFNSSYLRVKAYKDTLKKWNIPFAPELLKLGPHTFEFGISAAQELLKLEDHPTAIFASSDVIAAGALRAAAEAGLNVPGDVAVLGFDNINISKMVTPPLSTVAQPMRQIGNTAVETLIDKIKGNPVISEVYLEHEIILRKTT